MRDHAEIVVLLCFLKLRWAYFHLVPWYCKFTMDGKETHFQNMRTNTIHSRVSVEFKDGSPWKRFDGIY